MSSLFSISERIVSQKGSGAHVVVGLIILIVGVAVDSESTKKAAAQSQPSKSTSVKDKGATDEL